MTEHVAAYHAFVSYNSDDTDQVKTACASLQSRFPSLRLWLDCDDAEFGTTALSMLFQAIDRCKNMLVCVGPSGLGPFQVQEINYGLQKKYEPNGGFRVIPILLEGANCPRWLLGYSGVNLGDDPGRLLNLGSILLNGDLPWTVFESRQRLSPIRLPRLSGFLDTLQSWFESDELFCSFVVSIDLGGSSGNVIVQGPLPGVVEDIERQMSRNGLLLIGSMSLYSISTNEEVVLEVVGDAEDTLASAIVCRAAVGDMSSSQIGLAVESLLSREVDRSASSRLRRRRSPDLIRGIELVSYILLAVGALSVILWRPGDWWTLFVGVVCLTVSRWARRRYKRKVVSANWLAVEGR